MISIGKNLKSVGCAPLCSTRVVILRQLEEKSEEEKKGEEDFYGE